MESVATGAFQTVTEYLSLKDVVSLARASKALYQSVSRLPRWVDFSVPIEYLTYDQPKRKKNSKKTKLQKRKYYSDEDDDEVDDDEEDSYTSESDVSYSSDDEIKVPKDTWVRHFRDYIEIRDIPFFRDGVLESLDFTGVDCLDGLAFIFDLLKSNRFPNLSKLSIARDSKNCNYGYGTAKVTRKSIAEKIVTDKPSKLTHVNISGHSASFGEFHRLLGCCPNLKVFIAPYTTLTGQSQKQDSAPRRTNAVYEQSQKQSFFVNCLQLETLDLSYSYFTRSVSDRNFLLAELSELPNLKFLQIVGNEDPIEGKFKFRIVQVELWNSQNAKEHIFEEHIDLITVPIQFKRGLPFLFHVATYNMNCVKILLKHPKSNANVKIVDSTTHVTHVLDPWKPIFPCVGQYSFYKFQTFPEKSNLLHYAITADLNIPDLLSFKIQLNAENKEGLTPLSLAVVTGKSSLILDLLAGGADVNYTNEAGWAAIHYAVATCREGDTDIISILLQYKANINQPNKLGETPLNIACHRSLQQIAAYLVNSGATMDSPLLVHNIIIGNNDNKHILPDLEEEEEEDKKRKRKPKKTPQNSMFEFLEKSNYPFNNVDSQGFTPLMLAITNRYLNLIPLILATPTGLSSINYSNEGRTALHLAVETNSHFVDVLLKHGADVHSQVGGRTPLWELCVDRDNEKTMILLIQAGSNVNQCDLNGWSCIHGVVANQNKEMLQSLITAGADVNVTDKCGVTPLLVASYLNDLEIMKILLQNGAKLSGVNSFNNQTILHSYPYLSCKDSDEESDEDSDNDNKEPNKSTLRNEDLLQQILDSSLEFINHQYMTVEALYLYMNKVKGARADIVNNLGNTPLMECFSSARSKPDLFMEHEYENGYPIQYYPIWFCKGNIPKRDHKSNAQGNAIIDSLMNVTTDFSTVNIRGDSLLHLLIRSESLGSSSGPSFALLDTFIEKTGHLNTPNVFGDTPIFEAQKLSPMIGKPEMVRGSYFETEEQIRDKIVEKLLKAGAQVSILNSEGVSPLHSIRSPELFELFATLTSDINVNLQNFSGETVLHRVLRKSSVKTLPTFVEKVLLFGGDCNVVDNTGTSPLHEACSAGNGLVVKLMLQQPTTYPRLPNPMTGQTAASLALLSWLNEQTPLTALCVKLIMPFMDKEQKSLVSQTLVDRLTSVTDEQEEKDDKYSERNTLQSKIEGLQRIRSQILKMKTKPGSKKN